MSDERPDPASLSSVVRRRGEALLIPKFAWLARELGNTFGFEQGKFREWQSVLPVE